MADIHGNQIGLEAVLEELRAEQIDQLICLGDLAAGGPQPGESVARVRELGCPVIMGNGDLWMTNWVEPAEPTQEEPARQLLEIARWCRQQLSPDDLSFLSGLHATYEVRFDDRTSMLCFHGSPLSCYDVITSTTPDQELDRLFAGHGASILIGGHTHVPMLRRYGEAILINPGSVGLPHGRIRSRSPIRIPPCAEYAVVSVEGGKVRTELRRLPIDLDTLRRAALESGMPHARWWADRWG